MARTPLMTSNAHDLKRDLKRVLDTLSEQA